jgi:hypothetical protein
MDVVQLRGSAPPARSYSWTVALSRPGQRGMPLRFEVMNASEQMFFFGAPLAHVVCYEEHLRQQRVERLARDSLRARRPLHDQALGAPSSSPQCVFANADHG